MARTIAEIQSDILAAKNQADSLSALEILTKKEKGSLADQITNTSKAAVWRLWVYITAAAIWVHEKIVEQNALVSRPHTLEWYREQTLKFLLGRNLVFKDGFFEFDTSGLSEDEKETARIVKYCAVSEVDLDTIINQDGSLSQSTSSQDAANQVLSDYFHNQVGVVFIKVAKDDQSGNNITFLDQNEQANLKEYIKRIKDAGNQVQVTSIPGDLLSIQLDVYVDPLLIYVNPDGDQTDVNNGILIADGDTKPVEEAITNYLKNIEFNGALIKTFLIDAVQNTAGVNIPVFKELRAGLHSIGETNIANTDAIDNEFYIPNSGYFDLQKLSLSINYFPYTFYRNNQNLF